MIFWVTKSILGKNPPIHSALKSRFIRTIFLVERNTIISINYYLEWQVKIKWVIDYIKTIIIIKFSGLFLHKTPQNKWKYIYLFEWIHINNLNLCTLTRLPGVFDRFSPSWVTVQIPLLLAQFAAPWKKIVLFLQFLPPSV